MSAGVQLMDIVFFDGVFKKACIRSKAITSTIVPPAVLEKRRRCGNPLLMEAKKQSVANGKTRCTE